MPPSEISSYVGSQPDGPSDRTQMMFDFLLNPRVWLALARRDAEPLIEALTAAAAAARRWAMGHVPAQPR